LLDYGVPIQADRLYVCARSSAGCCSGCAIGGQPIKPLGECSGVRKLYPAIALMLNEF
jgi:hypothetical protein